jgi:hypothetical protein
MSKNVGNAAIIYWCLFCIHWPPNVGSYCGNVLGSGEITKIADKQPVIIAAADLRVSKRANSYVIGLPGESLLILKSS